MQIELTQKFQKQVKECDDQRIRMKVLQVFSLIICSLRYYSDNATLAVIDFLCKKCFQYPPIDVQEKIE